MLRLRVNKIPSQEDLGKLVTKLVREEIRNIPNTYTNWPPTAAELLRRKATTLPHLTEAFYNKFFPPEQTSNCPHEEKTSLDEKGKIRYTM